MKKVGKTIRPFQYDLNQIPNDYSGFPDSSVGKESTCNAGDPSWIPRLGRSAGEGIGYLLQYCPLSQWCHPAISSSVVPFSSCAQSLPASESFPMSQLFAWGGQSTGVSGLASFLPKNAQDRSPLEWTDWISLLFEGLLRVFSNTTVQKHQFFSAQLSL